MHSTYMFSVNSHQKILVLIFYNTNLSEILNVIETYFYVFTSIYGVNVYVGFFAKITYMLSQIVLAKHDVFTFTVNV